MLLRYAVLLCIILAVVCHPLEKASRISARSPDDDSAGPSNEDNSDVGVDTNNDEADPDSEELTTSIDDVGDVQRSSENKVESKRFSKSKLESRSAHYTPDSDSKEEIQEGNDVRERLAMRSNEVKDVAGDKILARDSEGDVTGDVTNSVKSERLVDKVETVRKKTVESVGDPEDQKSSDTKEMEDDSSDNQGRKSSNFKDGLLKLVHHGNHSYADSTEPKIEVSEIGGKFYGTANVVQITGEIPVDAEDLNNAENSLEHSHKNSKKHPSSHMKKKHGFNKQKKKKTIASKIPEIKESIGDNSKRTPKAKPEVHNIFHKGSSINNLEKNAEAAHESDLQHEVITKKDSADENIAEEREVEEAIDSSSKGNDLPIPEKPINGDEGSASKILLNTESNSKFHNEHTNTQMNESEKPSSDAELGKEDKAPAELADTDEDKNEQVSLQPDEAKANEKTVDNALHLPKDVMSTAEEPIDLKTARYADPEADEEMINFISNKKTDKRLENRDVNKHKRKLQIRNPGNQSETVDTFQLQQEIERILENLKTFAKQNQNSTEITGNQQQSTVTQEENTSPNLNEENTSPNLNEENTSPNLNEENITEPLENQNESSTVESIEKVRDTEIKTHAENENNHKEHHKNDAHPSGKFNHKMPHSNVANSNEIADHENSHKLDAEPYDEKDTKRSHLNDENLDEENNEVNLIEENHKKSHLQDSKSNEANNHKFLHNKPNDGNHHKTPLTLSENLSEKSKPKKIGGENYQKEPVPHLISRSEEHDHNVPSEYDDKKHPHHDEHPVGEAEHKQHLEVEGKSHEEHAHHKNPNHDGNHHELPHSKAVEKQPNNEQNLAIREMGLERSSEDNLRNRRNQTSANESVSESQMPDEPLINEEIPTESLPTETELTSVSGAVVVTPANVSSEAASLVGTEKTEIIKSMTKVFKDLKKLLKINNATDLDKRMLRERIQRYTVNSLKKAGYADNLYSNKFRDVQPNKRSVPQSKRGASVNRHKLIKRMPVGKGLSRLQYRGMNVRVMPVNRVSSLRRRRKSYQIPNAFKRYTDSKKQ